MNSSIGVAAVMLVALTCTNAANATLVTMAQLNAQLDHLARAKDGKPDKDVAAADKAVAYILGAADAFEISGDLCIASSVGEDEIVTSVATYLHDHRNEGTIDECMRVGCEASWLVRKALQDKFRCVPIP